MGEIVKLELKKIVNKNNFFIGILFLLICFGQIFPYSNSLDMVTKEGEFLSGFQGWKLMKEQGMAYDGTLTKDQMRKIRDLYNSSVQKPYIEGTVSGEGDYNLRLEFPTMALATTLNFPYANLGTLEMGMDLSDDQIDHFYENRLKKAKEYFSLGNWGFTEKQVDIIMEKAKSVRTPFVYSYCEGWAYLPVSLECTYLFFIMFLSFALAGTLSRDSIYGLSEMDLYTKEGKGKLFDYKIRAGEIFASISYFLYIFALLLYHFFIYSLHGWDSSLEFIITPSLYNLTVSQAFLIEAMLGYAVTIAYVNIIYLVSALFKRTYVNIAILSVVIVLLLIWSNSKLGIVRMLIPYLPHKYLGVSLRGENIKFFYNIPIPGFIAGLFLSISYVLFVRVFSKIIMRAYYYKGSVKR